MLHLLYALLQWAERRTVDSRLANLARLAEASAAAPRSLKRGDSSPAY
jgi:hypothetical protein